ncbi:IclR family transcriptional regulator [Murinocardiopsis flavida]|uniref:IclR family transcriptional regulator n=1 Tax=Murinocardiopsis flavida TaxID=645275 RepID=A0A2P8DKF0_9ACTN|nr:IclR family transcriptional regulator [Murinocardiopsis flavida]PSK97700.1 IclR family transcriptional regulator [Murinocardiopsis flavida]
MTPRPPKTQPLQTAVKSLRVLEAVAEAERAVRVSELGRQLGWSRAAVHQQLVTLVNAGWMEQNEDGSYRLTLRATRVGQAAMRQAGLGDRVMPAMERLVDEVREAVSFAILEHGSATIIQRLEPGRRLQVDLRAEAQMPISRSASGRVLIAFSTERQRAELAELGVELPDEAALDEIREQGHAISRGRWMDGVVGIAAPVFDIDDRCVGALSLAGPSGRFDVPAAVASLMARVADINQALSGRGPKAGDGRGTG